MRILIDTNGHWLDTVISLNDKKIDTLKEFHFSVHSGKRVKLQMVKEVDGQTEFISYYGDDFKKFDEYSNSPVKKENLK